jgi:Tfp pilus assembly protein PilX
MTHHRDLRSEDGWVMVPVIILLVVAIGVGMAILALVDGQTTESREQRSADSAQTLAEGAVGAAANVLAANQALWPTSGACQTISGDLTAAAPTGTTLADRIAAEVKSRFAGTTPDFTDTTTHTTDWRVSVCPVDAGDTSRWEETMLTRASVTPISASAPKELWVRGNANVRSRTGVTLAENARTVVSKLRQTSRTFDVPADFAVGTGVFSTDIGTTVSTTLTSNSSLLGGIVQPLVAAQTSKIGVRCGALETIENPSTTCLAGALAGVGGVTNATGLSKLNTILGLRNEALETWTMAPDDAIEAWRAEAQRTGNVYVPASAPVAGYGDDTTKSVSGRVVPGHNCFSGTPTADTVIFIEQVGDGDDYCNVPANSRAKILIVERGAIHIKDGTFTGVVYALNKQECGGDGDCSTAERESAIPREVVRIDGNAGKVIGAVWADGAGGAVGIYPSLVPSNVSNTSLLGVGSATTGICGLSAVASTLTTLNTALTGVTGLLGTTLSLVTGIKEEVRYPNGASAPTGCDLLKNKLGTLTSSELINLFGTGATHSVPTSERRTQTCTARNILGLCTTWSAWSAWSTKTSSSVPVTALLTGASPSVVAQLSGLLGGLLNNYTAITYDEDTVADAAAQINRGAAPIVGTYRNVGAST